MLRSLDILLNRLFENLPEKYHPVIEKEISEFETEISMLSIKEEKIGQARLTQHEVERLPTKNQHGGKYGLTVVQWQSVKGCAMHYGVTDWTAKIDAELSVKENKEIMRKEGKGETLREKGQVL
jgi:hypothetical protein